MQLNTSRYLRSTTVLTIQQIMISKRLAVHFVECCFLISFVTYFPIFHLEFTLTSMSRRTTREDKGDWEFFHGDCVSYM